ncbi:MAG: DUF4230 domain-containing protein [Bacteroidota bacterium]
MAKEKPSLPTGGLNLQNTGRLLIFVLVLSLLAIVAYKYLWNKATGFTTVPQEVQLNYMPSEFNMEIDEENAMAILSNPRRYRREFNELVFDLNIDILDHVSKRMGLSDTQRRRARVEYEKHHPYLRSLYYNDFIQLKDTTSNFYQTWYDNEASSSIEMLQEVASKYTCFLVNHVLTSIIETEGGSFFAKGQSVDTPCGIALTEALQPMMKRMEERAAIEDFSRSRGMLQEKVERIIAELATMEVQDKKGLNKRLQTKVWGFSVSSSDIEIAAISKLKVGFRLNDYFDVSLDSRNGIVSVTLPEPTILSHEVYPKIDKLDIGWLREVKNIDLNENFNVLRQEFRRDALESDIMDKAKTQAVELMNTMFSPLVSTMNNRYKLRVKFRQFSDVEELNTELSDRQVDLD